MAAAGRHNLLLIGSPGAGKSMLAQRPVGILPRLDSAETLEVSMIQRVAGHLRNGGLSRERPFRDPHHSGSQVAMVGGGIRARPRSPTSAFCSSTSCQSSPARCWRRCGL